MANSSTWTLAAMNKKSFLSFVATLKKGIIAVNEKPLVCIAFY